VYAADLSPRVLAVGGGIALLIGACGAAAAVLQSLTLDVLGGLREM
jgi:hypothetical protein